MPARARGQLTLYVDGKSEFQAGATFDAPVEFQDSPQFAVGAFSANTYQAVGSFDEVAVWRRALTADEIQAVYRRGALRLSLQVRTCTDALCADAPRFVGPDDSATASFVEPGTALPLGDGSRGRYLQYKVHLESAIPDQSPAVDAVELAAGP